MKNIYFIILFGLLLSGCASTRMTSFKDPDYEHSTFRRILVIVNTSDLEKKLYFESKLAKVFNEEGIYAKEGFKLFPPTRDLTKADKIDLLIRDSLDAYISVYVGESGVEQVYVPPTSTNTKTEGTATISGDRVHYEEKSKTTVNGGYTISKPWAEFYGKLFEVATGRTVWISSAFTGGSAFSSFYTVINSFCDQLLDQLVADKLVKTSAQIQRELYISNSRGWSVDSSNEQYLFPKDDRRMVRFYLDNGSVYEVFLIGQTPSKYLFLPVKEYAESIKYIRKAVVQKIVDIK